LSDQPVAQFVATALFPVSRRNRIVVAEPFTVLNAQAVETSEVLKAPGLIKRLILSGDVSALLMIGPLNEMPIEWIQHAIPWERGSGYSSGQCI